MLVGKRRQGPAAGTGGAVRKRMKKELKNNEKPSGRDSGGGLFCGYTVIYAFAGCGLHSVGQQINRLLSIPPHWRTNRMLL